jgi:hypothetical protein
MGICRAMSQLPDTSTIPPVESGMTSWERPLRFLAVGVIIAIVVAASLGLLGVRTAQTVSAAHGMVLTVTHAAVTRPGLGTPFSVEVASADGDGLPSEVELRIESSYLEMFDEVAIEPLPIRSYDTSQWTWWTFEVPAGESSLQVDVDAHLKTTVKWARRGSVAVESNGIESVAVDFTTLVAP